MTLCPRSPPVHLSAVFVQRGTFDVRLPINTTRRLVLAERIHVDRERQPDEQTIRVRCIHSRAYTAPHTSRRPTIFNWIRSRARSQYIDWKKLLRLVTNAYYLKRIKLTVPTAALHIM